MKLPLEMNCKPDLAQSREKYQPPYLISYYQPPRINALRDTHSRKRLGPHTHRTLNDSDSFVLYACINRPVHGIPTLPTPSFSISLSLSPNSKLTSSIVMTLSYSLMTSDEDLSPHLRPLRCVLHQRVNTSIDWSGVR
jgi:hypothetical protein